MRRAEILRAATARLWEAGVDDPAREARILLAEASGLTRAALSARLEEVPPPVESVRFAGMLAARLERRPMAQILGRRAFYGRDFKVTKDTLDPRPDSETLIDEALAALERRGARGGSWRMLDLGTGTGCLLLTMLAECGGATGLGVDVSPAALGVARQNAAALGLSGRALFQEGDWLEGLTERFDVILCNPPYISADERGEMSPEVLRHEPPGALFAGEDGLEDFRRILPAARRTLGPGGFLALEHGFRQRESLVSLAQSLGWRLERAADDAGGRPRALILCF